MNLKARALINRTPIISACYRYHQFVSPEAAAMPRSSTTEGGEQNGHFMLGWAL